MRLPLAWPRLAVLLVDVARPAVGARSLPVAVLASANYQKQGLAFRIERGKVVLAPLAVLVGDRRKAARRAEDHLPSAEGRAAAGDGRGRQQNRQQHPDKPRKRPGHVLRSAAGRKIAPLFQASPGITAVNQRIASTTERAPVSPSRLSSAATSWSFFQSDSKK